MSIAIYCDESCHLEHDESNVMGFGAIWTPRTNVRSLSAQLRDMKRRHRAAGELKWTKVSKSKLDFYQEVVDWFFDSDALHFRALLVPNKQALDHAKFNQGSHDDFYYKMYFSMLNKILSPTEQHEIYLDIKDTRSNRKVKKLREVLCNNQYDFTGDMVARIQQARSHELELMQLTDLILGALVHRHRGIETNYGKQQVIQRIEGLYGRSLLKSSPLSSQKFNLFVWRAQ
ncbi:DUF3800 domain-containing protein [Bradyrhizobium diazoefficiens]|uniref:DUF3800 domain-containing protein n=1 Tax=Bradyrhizobium diazoefficiens TaxID=1355477 RepID=UPI00272C9A98|nr:DUF3800 domain-containing protein [Bradyrhizobium diazoefficiens]WLA65665.1 DUF3800 domain-containing protein [Bradyrhizobium diazoefficiens]